MDMKFHNFDIFYKLCYIFDRSSALACRMESINNPPFFTAADYDGSQSWIK